jgi:hypothetical protein
MAATAYDKSCYDLAVEGWRRACQAKTSDPGYGAGHPATLASRNNLVRHEPRIDIPGHAGGIVSQRHGSTAHDEYVGDHTPPGQALAQGGESPLQSGPVKENAASLAHAASRSQAERYTPCLRNAAGAHTSASAR